MSLLCSCAGRRRDKRTPPPEAPPASHGVAADLGSASSLSYLRSPPQRRKFPAGPDTPASSSAASSRSGASFWFGQSSESSLYPGANARSSAAWRRRSGLSWCKHSQSECAALAHHAHEAPPGAVSGPDMWLARSAVSLAEHRRAGVPAEDDVQGRRGHGGRGGQGRSASILCVVEETGRDAVRAGDDAVEDNEAAAASLSAAPVPRPPLHASRWLHYSPKGLLLRLRPRRGS
ncbi:uncharacterized protein LOC113210474 [Frankliniella occidentalis]|uniref:Uncharacterized protein LOC113210474 n=1 Tax=Frankliniella occidentalis TaxID=133901 RepID=A0A6J1STS9_FRAOC|nr:uncharacterized protein LOC113210474 [Frankliniella occidentalis]